MLQVPRAIKAHKADGDDLATKEILENPDKLVLLVRLDHLDHLAETELMDKRVLVENQADQARMVFLDNREKMEKMANLDHLVLMVERERVDQLGRKDLKVTEDQRAQLDQQALLGR